MSDADGLVAFLRARLDHLEQHAKKDLWALDRCSAGGDWYAREGFGLPFSEIWIDGRPVDAIDEVGKVAVLAQPGKHQADALVVARFVKLGRERAARALAEVEAKRRLLNDLDARTQAAAGGCELHEDAAIRGTLVTAVEYAALPHADHPDYREEWRP